MDTRKLERKLESHFEATRIEPDPHKKAATVAAIRRAATPESTARTRNAHADGVTFARFVQGQVRFIGARTWIAQAALLAFMFLACTWTNGGLESSPIVAAFGALTVVVGLPELFKSSDENVAELEYACRFDCRHVTLSRLIILGLSDIVMLTCAMIAVPALSGMQPVEVLLFACIPYFGTCALGFWIANHVKRGTSTQLSLVLGLAIALSASAAWQSLPKVYLMASTGVWAALFGIVAVVAFLQAKEYLTRVGAGLDHLKPLSVRSS
ncbi:hypothetical protein [Raoultibacter phocaeensis]|uniref:hypothetical protein n=1 Tax=Raoultibacter phocaeensis TaxID=2479841 RepID=UPI00111A2F7A|nr:hypothetical protein [Raoultibacter phocaeensis]